MVFIKPWIHIGQKTVFSLILYAKHKFLLFHSFFLFYSHFLLLLPVTAATEAKNQIHESRTDEDVYLYLRTCSAQSKRTSSSVLDSCL